MASIDANLLTVPLWNAIAIGATVFSVLIGVVVWVFTFFTTKEDTQELRAEHEQRLTKLEEQWDRFDDKWEKLRDDVSNIKEGVAYVKGKVEPK